jgi:hypothetical protein
MTYRDQARLHKPLVGRNTTSRVEPQATKDRGRQAQLLALRPTLPRVVHNKEYRTIKQLQACIALHMVRRECYLHSMAPSLGSHHGPAPLLSL